MTAQYDSPSTTPVILLTGRPGIGIQLRWTTAIRQIVATLGGEAGGFRKRYAPRARDARSEAPNGL